MFSRWISVTCFFSSLGVGVFSPLVSAHAASEAPLPLSVVQAAVWVECGHRQGSGTVTNGNEGYVLTNAHVVLEPVRKEPKEPCIVGFVESQGAQPTIFYKTTIIRYALDAQQGRDFAILQITEPLTARALSKPFPFVKTNEFAKQDDSIRVIGYSGPNDEQRIRSGKVRTFQNGFLQTTAQISPGDSGGAALDSEHRLIGIPTRIVTLTSEVTNEQEISYEFIDIRAVINWMDSYGPNDHDRFIGHSDFDHYHKSVAFIQQASLGCSDVFRSPYSPTVFCALPGRERWAFPNDKTFLSWFPDFTNVLWITNPSSISAFSLTRNATFRPGTLVKSATSPRVYVVVDSYGTMRWIPTEERAIAIWGHNWASLVKDIADEFWANYIVGQPLDP